MAKSKVPSSSKGKGIAKRTTPKNKKQEEESRKGDEPSTSTGIMVEQNNQMMLELMEELRRVKEQLQSTQEQASRDNTTSRRKLTFENEDGQSNQERGKNTGPNIKDQAQQRVDDAGKFRAEFIKPKGKQTIPTYDLEKVYEFPDKPMLNDDQLVQMTCHVEDTEASKAHESQFMDLEKLLNKYSRSFHHEESQKN